MRSYQLLPLGLVFLLLIFFASCASEVKWDKEAISKVNKIAVVLYSVPLTIEIRDNPRSSSSDKSTLQILAEVAQSAATAANGMRAATLAQKTFIETLNRQGLPFKAISQAEMMGNSKFMTLSTKALNVVMAAQAKAEEEREKKQGAAGKALSFISGFAGGGGPQDVFGAGPEGLPSFGLVPDWFGAKSALMGVPQEREYILAAIKALNVDAALVVNDPGFSWGCETCIAKTGNASTQSAFVATLVASNGDSILELKQWFSIGGGNAAMVSGIINPLQYDNLYIGHGEKMARVFGDFYKEETEKK